MHTSAAGAAAKESNHGWTQRGKAATESSLTSLMYGSKASYMNPAWLSTAVCCLFITASSTAIAQVNVLTYHNNNARTGANLSETILRPDNVTVSTFGKRITYSVDGYVYAQPLYVSDLAIPGRGEHILPSARI